MVNSPRVYFIPIYFEDPTRINAASARYRCSWPSLALLGSKVWSVGEDVLTTAKDFDVVVFQKLHSDQTVELAKQLKTAGKVIVFDLADPLSHYNLLQISKMIVVSDLLTVSSVALKSNYKKAFPNKSIYAVEDGEHLDFYREHKTNYELVSHKPVISWYGIADTLPNLNYGLEVLSDFKDKVTFKVISNQSLDKSGYDIDFKEWQLDTYAVEIINSDLVINSRSNTDDNRYKSLNKTVTAWALGLPCLFRFENKRFTINYLQKLLDSITKRRQNAINGNYLVNNYYNTGRVARQLNLVFQKHTGKINTWQFNYQWLIIRISKYFQWSVWYLRELRNYYF